MPEPAAPVMPPELRRAAEAAVGFMPAAEGLALFGHAVAAATVGPLLEVGTWCGKSALYLAAAARVAAARSGRSQQPVVSVDHHRGSEENQPGWPYHDPSLVDPLAGRLDTLPHARRTLTAAGADTDVTLVVGDSVTVAGLWGRPLGLLFIDGGHAFDVADADARAWVPHLHPAGLLVLHDVFPDPADGGQAPWQVWQRLLAAGFVECAVTGSLRAARPPRPSRAGGVPDAAA